MYLISKDNQGIIIDPGFINNEANDILKKIKKECNEIPAILLTHGHFDHISGCNMIKKEFKSKIYCHKFELEKLSDPQKSGAILFPIEENQIIEVDEYLQDSDKIDFITLRFKIIHTPGHTKGGISILLDDKFLFSGDTIFKDSIGRTDFYDGSYQEEISSIKMKILTLPLDTTIYPGHGPQTTVRQEKKYFNN